VRARYISGNGTRKWRLIVPSALVVIGSCLIGFPYFYQAHWGFILAGGLLWIIGTLLFYTLPRVYRPEGFAVPLNPFLPCLGTLANIFLIGEPVDAAHAIELAGVGYAAAVDLLQGLEHKAPAVSAVQYVQSLQGIVE
jgi:drug/metabolite transporter (DMT)-like permease